MDRRPEHTNFGDMLRPKSDWKKTHETRETAVMNAFRRAVARQDLSEAAEIFGGPGKYFLMDAHETWNIADISELAHTMAVMDRIRYHVETRIFEEEIEIFISQLSHSRPSYLLDVLRDAYAGKRDRAFSDAWSDLSVSDLRTIALKHAPEFMLPQDGYLRFLDDLIREHGSEYIDAIQEADLRKGLSQVNLDDEPLMRDRLVKKQQEHLRVIYHDKQLPPIVGAPEGAITARVAPEVRGAFDADGRLLGVAKSAENTMVPLAALPEFRASGDPSADVRRGSVLLDVESIMDLRARSLIEGDMDISLADLTLREQVWLLGSMRDAEQKDWQRIQTFLKRFGLDGARTFLSVEHDDRFRETILEIGKRLSVAQAKAVFARYAEISTIAQGAVEEIAAAALDTTKGRLDPEALQNELLHRAKALLEQAAKFGAKQEDILAALEASKAETVLFASICKAYFKNNREARLEDVRGLQLETAVSGGIDKKDQVQMETMLRANWRKQRPEAVETLVADLQRKMDDPTSRATFYVLKKEGRLLGFLSFSKGHPDAPDGVYGDSFNVDPELNRSGLGTAMLLRTIDQEAAKHPVYAHADPASAAMKMYIEQFGFNVVGSEQESMPDGTVVTWAKLKRDDRQRAAPERPSQAPIEIRT